MPDTLPPYKRHRRSSGDRGADRAYVFLDGQRVYLGRYDSVESHKRYAQVLAEWEANQRLSAVSPEEITIAELLDRYWTHVWEYYRHPDGSPTATQDNIRHALKPLRELYENTRVAEFSPKSLKAVRQRLIARKLSRTYVNGCVDRIKRAFKWGVTEELVDVEVFQRLQTLEGLRAGRSSARETDPVKPVPDSHVDAVRPHVSRQIWAMIELQRLTGARSGEVLAMRAVDLDTSGPVWEYRPGAHKTAHHGHERLVWLGPRAQRVVRPFMRDRALDAYLFSPRDADEERRAAREAVRKTPLSCGNRRGTNRVAKPKRRAGERYTRQSYLTAIRRACKRAGSPTGTPTNFATTRPPLCGGSSASRRRRCSATGS